jgi:hypothetical protein
LRQGIPLKPLPRLLEALTAAILGELASRPLAHPELERLNRQLPMFPTRKLVGIARASLGLPEEPPPGFRWPAPPGPVPAQPALPDPMARAAWADLWALAQSARPAAHYWACVLRTGADLKAQRKGPYASWAAGLPLQVARLSDARRVREKLDTRGLRAFVRGYLAVVRPLERIHAWLADPLQPLDAEALQALERPDWLTWRWTLLEPARLLAQADELESYRAFLQA